MSDYNTISIESFYPELIEILEVQEAIEEQLGEEVCKRIVKQFKENTPYLEIEGDFEDIIQEVIENEGTVYEQLTGLGGNGEYPIDIFNFGPLYWVHAQEYDPIIYFKSYEDAEECAISTYGL
jgi:hypothetical protein